MARSKTQSARTLSVEEVQLWKHVTGSVTSLGKSTNAIDHIEPGAVLKLLSKIPEAVCLPTVQITKPSSRKTEIGGLDRKTRSRIAKGRNPLGGTLDLHGMRQAEAHRALRKFLANAQQQGARFVIVVTGKGGRINGHNDYSVHSRQETGVLRAAVPHWFATEEFSQFVAGFSQAAPGHGGSGAIYVQIRQNKPIRQRDTKSDHV